MGQTQEQVLSKPPNLKHPNLITPSTPHSPHANSFPASNPSNNNTASFPLAIHLLNLNQSRQNPLATMPNLNSTLVADLEPHTVPPTPTNYLNTDDTRINPNENANILHASPIPPRQNPSGNGSHNASFSSRPPWQPSQESNLQWTWIKGSGPYITND